MALDLNKAASRNGKRTERILLGICSCVVGILMLIYLVWILLQAGKRIPFAASVFANVNAAGLVIPGAAALAMLFFLLYSAVGSLAAGRQKILAGGVLAGMILLQMVFLYFVRYYVIYDNVLVLSEIKHMLETGHIDPLHFNYYYQRYPHNFPITIFLYGLFKAASILGVLDWYWTPALIGMVSIDIACVFSVLTIARIRNARTACLLAAILLLNPLLYAWIPWCYTTVVSLPFLMGALYFVVVLWQTDTFSTRLIAALCLGIFAAVGIKIRATTGILFIACAIVFVLRSGWKRLRASSWGIMLAVILPYLAVTAGMNHAIDKYVDFDRERNAFTVTHYLMMGLGPEGTFNPADVEFSLSMPGKEERQAANIAECRRRVENWGLEGLIGLWGRKVRTTWADGSGGLQQAWTQPAGESNIYLYMIGDKNDLFLLYCQLFYVLLLILAAGHAVRMLFVHRIDAVFLLMLTILGHFIFYMLWEAQNHYSIAMTCIFCMLGCLGAADAADHLGQNLVKDSRSAASRYVAAEIILGFVCAAVFAGGVIQRIRGFEMRWNEYLIRNTYSMGDGLGPVKDGDVIEQEFYAETPFNHVSLMLSPGSVPETGGALLLEVIDDENNEIITGRLSAEEIAAREVHVRSAAVIPERKTHYRLRIRTEGTRQTDQLQLLRFNADLDLSPETRLIRNNEAENGDLCFSISYEGTGSYLPF